MRHLHATALSLALMISAPAWSEAPPSHVPLLADEAATRRHCSELAELYLRGDESVLREQFDSMMAPALALTQQEVEMAGANANRGLPIPMESLVAMARDELGRQFQNVITRLRRSPAIDQEYVATERFGSAALRHAHLLRFEEQGWRLDCAYYRGKDGWIVRPALPQAEFMGGLFTTSPGTNVTGAKGQP